MTEGRVSFSSDGPAVLPPRKRRTSWAAEVEDCTPQTLKSTGERQTVRLGILRLGNVYKTSVALPGNVRKVEILPFLSTSIVAEACGGVGEGEASLALTFSALREGKFAENITLDLVLEDEQPMQRELHVSVEGAVMGRDTGKPLLRRGVSQVSEGAPEDYDTEGGTSWAGTTWAGFGKRAGSHAGSPVPDSDVEEAPGELPASGGEAVSDCNPAASASAEAAPRVD
eukprot:CAMPEP_0171058730 /NCGR_PEP_ID=MMETSP0766_2-20121228/2691_1 /TAXON_ID=439317 /ORGANISM="Gambierdiscus australes, Strain CAWD 149" /LENGTH=226 /DNA_ID=CAMNT_0011514047 /DNA_START=23 /DNA_END=703 /DNA_ORIENTATION=-